MKVKSLAYALIVAACMMSCTAESDQLENLDEVTLSLEKTFNARSLSYTEGSKNLPNLSELPPVSFEETESILYTLRAKKNLSEDHSLQTENGEPGQKFLTISTECHVGSQHDLTIQLSMITYEDDGSLYYKDCHAFASSELYKWQLTGFGLSSTRTAGIYSFECVSYLYFKIADKGIKYFQVPVRVQGEYNSDTQRVNFTYSL